MTDKRDKTSIQNINPAMPLLHQPCKFLWYSDSSYLVWSKTWTESFNIQKHRSMFFEMKGQVNKARSTHPSVD